MPTRFLHTADWQLGKPYEHIDKGGDKRMLNHAADKCLRVILFTHPPALFKAMGADETNL